MPREDNSFEPSILSQGSPSYRWVMLGMAWYLHFSNALVLFSIAPLIGLIIQEFSISFFEAGLLLGSITFGTLFLSILAGSISDKIGTRKAIAIAGILSSSGALLRGISFGFLDLLIFSTMVSVGTAIAFVSLPKMTREWFPQRQRASTNGVWNSGFNIGALFTFAASVPLTVGVLGNWRLVFIIYGVVSLIATLLWISLSRGNAGRADETGIVAPRNTAYRLRQVAKSKDVWLFFLIFVFFMGSHMAVLSWLPALLQSRGMVAQTAGIVTSVVWIGSMASSLIIPRLSDRIGLRKPFMFFFIPSYGFSVYAITLLDGPILFVAVANLGFSASYLMVFAPTISQELPEMDVGSYGTAMGSIIAGYGVGGTVFSLLVGLVRDTAGSMHIAMFVLIASTQLALLALIPLRETGWRDSST